MNRDPEQLLQDPLQEVTRKERRNLLGVAITGIVVVLMELEPKGISAFGITFDGAQYKHLLSVWGGLVVYFLAAFAVYAGRDFLAWRYAMAILPKKKELEDHLASLDREEKFREQLRNGQGTGAGSVVSRVDVGIAKRKRDEECEERIKVIEQTRQPYITPSQIASVMRIAFDAGLPIVVGLLAIRLLLF